MSAPRCTFRLVAALLLVASLALAGCFGGDDEAEAEPTATGTAGGGAAADSTSEAGASGPAVPDAAEVTVEQDLQPLPAGLALYVSGTERIYNDRGEVRRERIFQPEEHEATSVVTYSNVHTLGATLPDGWLALTACTAGDCGGLSTASADARTSLFRSSDGGIAWVRSADLDGVYQVAGGVDPQHLLLRRLPREGGPDGPHFEWWPEGAEVEPAPGWDGERNPVVFADESLGWWSGDGQLLGPEGATILDLREQVAEGASARGIAGLPALDGQRLAVTWAAGDDEQWYWSIYEGGGAGWALARTFEAPFAMIPTAWAGSSALLVNADLDPAMFGQSGPQVRLPATLNVESGSLRAIDVGEPLGQGWVVAAQQGPFVLINAGAGDCLNLRSEPTTDSNVLECLYHGMLVRPVEGDAGEDGWLQVRVPTGAQGWVSTQWIRRLGDPSAGAAATGTAEATAGGEATATATATQ